MVESSRVLVAGRFKNTNFQEIFDLWLLEKFLFQHGA
jgi:hypothetical protein